MACFGEGGGKKSSAEGTFFLSAEILCETNSQSASRIFSLKVQREGLKNRQVLKQVCLKSEGLVLSSVTDVLAHQC